MDLLFTTEASATVGAAASQYSSLLEEGLSVPYSNSFGIASVLARDMSLALFFIMTSFRGRPSYPKALFHCDFEDGWCPGFKSSPSGDIPWNLWKGKTPSNKTGPTVDHTRFNKDGTYLYLEASNSRFGDTAVFTTPPVMMLAKPYYCLRYWYHMRGTGMGSLWIYWNAAGEENIHTVVDKRSGPASEEGEDWVESLISLPTSSRTKYYRPVVFEFRGVRGFSYTSDIAIDDVLLMPGKCDEIIFSAAATTMTFRGITTTPQPNTTTTLSWKAKHPDWSSCGDSYYNVKKQMCCLETIRAAPTFHHRCCGDKIFHQIYNLCCGGTPIWINTHGCCFNRIPYVKKKRGCCGDTRTYDLMTEVCENGTIKKRKTKRRGKRFIGEVKFPSYRI